MTADTAALRKALDGGCFETVRRLCAAVAEPSTELLWLHHEALLALGDVPAALALLRGMAPADDDDRLNLLLAEAYDWHKLADYGFYRGSAEARAGLSGDEYADQKEAEADRCLTAAEALAGYDPERRQRLARALRLTGRKERADAIAPPSAPTVVASPAPVDGTSTVRGTIRLAHGQPAVGVLVTLGLAVEVIEEDPSTWLKPQMHYMPRIGQQQALTARTGADGRFAVTAVPPGNHAFLAVTLDPDAFDLPTRFLRQGIGVGDGETVDLGILVADEWTSAPAEPPPAFPASAVANRQLIVELPLRNPFYFDFPRQWLTMPLPVNADPAQLRLVCSIAPDVPLPCQPVGDAIGFFGELPAMSERVYALFVADQPPVLAPCLDLIPETDGRTGVVDTGRARFRLPLGEGADGLPPLMAVMGEDGLWRGQGRFMLPAGIGVATRRTTVLTRGPLLLEVEIAYELSDGSACRYVFSFHRGEATLLAREIAPPSAEIAFEFSLREFGGGRGFLHWTPENGNRHWRDLEAADVELARLQESVAWWIPPQGFGYAMTAGALDSHDYIAVFTRHRGDWIDREFDRLTRGPIGPDGKPNWELDWPFPEMVGSTISMITAHTDDSGDAFFRFRGFDGERQWGLLVSTLDRNDGPMKELSAVQHKTSSPALQAFKEWRLDEADHAPRPHVVARRENLRQLRAKRHSPRFAKYWEILQQGTRGAADGLRFAVEADPLVAWRKKLELVGVAHIRSRMTLLGRDFADMYSPVGARPITPWAEEYDLIAGSGVFTPDEERLVRRFLLLMGHLYMSPDLMNWRYGSRNANFESDRVDVVGAVGLVFHGNPDADAMIRHAVELMERAVDTYCTPGSGKWYENPACYYLTTSKCRSNLAFHLAQHGIYDVTALPRYRDFLRWGIVLLTPPLPARMEAMRDGLGAAEWETEPKVRRIPPIGDHAHLGPWVPEHYALMAKLYRPTDPAFADYLLGAYQAGGADGGYFGNVPLLFAALDDADLAPAPPPPLASRRLEGFGAVLRRNVGQPNEFYLLIKQGPGGYRYHRTEGSFLLVADGKPLIYDGGEAGETWRHSTLAFHDTHLPLAPGRVTRFATFPELELVQGVHPKALEPGDPVFLSDSCEHQLVPVAWERFAEPNPAVVRSFLHLPGEYVLAIDDLRLPAGLSTHWHLQVVADDECGSLADGWRFRGRFGTDLQVKLLADGLTDATIATVPILEYHLPPGQCFAMRHLQVSGISPRRCVALLRPLSAGQAPLTVRTVGEHGIRVTGEGVDDTFVVARETVRTEIEGVAVDASLAAVVRRGGRTSLVLPAGGRVEAFGRRLVSDGPARQDG